MVIDAELSNEFRQLYGVERKEKGTEYWSLRDTTDKRSLRWQRMSHKNLLGPARQIRAAPIQDNTNPAD